MDDCKAFRDSNGIQWTVYRVEPEVISPTLQRLRESLTHAPERRRAWLLFESARGERCRLVPVPDAWATDPTDSTLDQWRLSAERVPPAPQRRATDASP